MGKLVTEEDFEEVYALAQACVEKYVPYKRCCRALIDEWYADPDPAEPSAEALAAIDGAKAELLAAAMELKAKLLPIRRAIHAQCGNVVYLLDEAAPSHIEALLRVALREGQREEWTGRLDFRSKEHLGTLGGAESARAGDREGAFVRVFDAKRLSAELDLEAGRLIHSVVGEFDHVLRVLVDAPRRLMDLLVERRGQVVGHEDICASVSRREDVSANAVYRARNRLKNALIKAGFGEIDGRITSQEGGYRLD